MWMTRVEWNDRHDVLPSWFGLHAVLLNISIICVYALFVWTQYVDMWVCLRTEVAHVPHSLYI